MLVYKPLPASNEAYNVTFYAYNPDNATLRSPDFTLSVYVRAPCNVTFDKDEYFVVELLRELNVSVSVLDVSVTSNCDESDIRFVVFSQTVRNGKLLI